MSLPPTGRAAAEVLAGLGGYLELTRRARGWRLDAQGPPPSLRACVAGARGETGRAASYASVD